MIIIGLGSNLPSDIGGPLETLRATLAALAAKGLKVVRCSPFFRSAPVPLSDQPWFVNAVAEVETGQSPAELMALLHATELGFGRVRRQRNEARIIDLDLITYHDRVSEPGEWPELPHPRMHDRAFVLLPLERIAPDWRHPRTGRSVAEMIAALPAEQEIHELAAPEWLAET